MDKQPLPSLQDFADSLPVGILLLDLLGKCVFSNKAWEDITQRSKSDAMGNGWTLFIDDQDAPKLTQALSLLLQNHAPFVLDLKYLTPSKETRSVQMKFSVYRSEAWNAMGFVGCVWEIGDLGKELDVLRKRNTDLSNLNRLLIDRELRMAELKKQVTNTNT